MDIETAAIPQNYFFQVITLYQGVGQSESYEPAQSLSNNHDNHKLRDCVECERHQELNVSNRDYTETVPDSHQDAVEYIANKSLVSYGCYDVS